MAGQSKIIVVFMDGKTREFYADSTYEMRDGVFLWQGNIHVDNRSVDYYSIPSINVREVFEYE